MRLLAFLFSRIKLPLYPIFISFRLLESVLYTGEVVLSVYHWYVRFHFLVVEGSMKFDRSQLAFGAFYGVVMLGICMIMFLNVIPLNLPFSSPTPPVKFGAGWQTEDGKDVNVGQLYEVVNVAGEPITLSKQVPDEIYNDSYLNFISENVNVTFYIDGDIIYSFEGTDPLGYGGIEAYFHHVRMDKSYVGKDLVLQVTPAYDDTSCYLDETVICAVNDYSLYIMEKCGTSLFMSIIIFFMGLLMIVQYFSVPREYHAYNTFALGTASIAVGVWCALETHVPMLLLGKLTPYLLMLDLLIMYFLPFPLIVFFSSAISHRSRLAEHAALILSCCAIVVEAIVTLNGVLTVHTSDIIFYLLFASTFVIGFIIGIRSFILVRRDPSTKRMTRSTAVAVFILAAALLIYFIVYLISRSLDVDSMGILRIGFIVTQIVLFGGFMAKANKNSRSAAESEAMRKLAYLDALTGIGNRAAFDMAFDELEKREGEEVLDFMIVCFDVDDLKRVNDTYGHEFGDKHIIASSHMLVEAFGECGDIYRTGGDEFSMLVSAEKDPVNSYKRGLERLHKLEDEYNTINPERPIRISCGTCLFSQTATHTIREALNKADEAMYADKMSHKQEKASTRS